MLELKEIKIANQIVPLKKCFPHHQIYINKLPDNFNREDIEKHFGKYGKIVSIELLQAEGAYETSITAIFALKRQKMLKSVFSLKIDTLSKTKTTLEWSELTKSVKTMKPIRSCSLKYNQ